MATTKTTDLTNFDAEPRSRLHVTTDGGRVRTLTGSAAVAAGEFDADGDEIHHCLIPSNANITSMKFASDAAIDGGTDSIHNIGLKTADGEDFVDEDLFGTLVTDFQGGSAWTEYRYETLGIETTGQKIWELLGLTEDPNVLYRVVSTQTVGSWTSGAADVAHDISYTVD